MIRYTFPILGLIAWWRKARFCTTKHKVAEPHGEENRRCQGQEEIDPRPEAVGDKKSGKKEGRPRESGAGS